jgi:hypothetical protein
MSWCSFVQVSRLVTILTDAITKVASKGDAVNASFVGGNVHQQRLPNILMYWAVS